MKYQFVLFISLFCLLFCTIPVSVSAQQAPAQPLLPHAFYGSIDSGGQELAAGIQIEAVADGIMTGIAGNPVPVENSKYGADGAMSPKLLVQGNLNPGTPIKFRIGGMPAQIYNVKSGVSWQDSYPYSPGDVTQLNIRWSSSANASVSPAATSVFSSAPATSPYSTVPQSGPDAVSAAVKGQSGTMGGTSSALQLSKSLGESDAGTISNVSGNAAGPGSSGIMLGEMSCTTATSPAGSVLDAKKSISPQWIAAGIIILVLAGGVVYYYSLRKKT